MNKNTPCNDATRKMDLHQWFGKALTDMLRAAVNKTMIVDILVNERQSALLR